MVGKSLSHYKILDELGRGGMGIVYKAEDTKLDRTVAIKILPSAALASEDDRARFYREAKAAAQLHHPHIASVFEIDEAVPEGSKDDDLRPFISMEFIEGETLHDRIQKGPLKLEEAVRIASQIASGLEAAHEKDIVHRDLKSQNVMLTAKGEAKILDFGLAQTAASTKLTRMGSTLGTVAYMSPEQARGEEVDLRTDLWSLGVVLYEMIAGRSPFPGDYEQAVVYEILNQDPEPLTAIRADVPMELERIVRKCLAKDSVARYQSTKDLLVDLNNIGSMTARLMGTSETTGPRIVGTKVSKGSVRWLPFLGVLLLGSISTALIFLFLGPFVPESSPVFRKIPIHLGSMVNVNYPNMHPDETQMYFSGTNKAGLMGIYVLDFQSSQIDLVEERGYRPEVSPNGSMLAFRITGEGSYVKRLPSGRSRLISEHLYWPLWIDEQTIVGQSSTGIKCLVIDLVSGTERTLFEVDTTAYPGVTQYVTGVDRENRLIHYSYDFLDATPPVLYVYDMKTDFSTELLEGGTSPRYAGSENLIYQRSEGTEWFVQSFNPEKLVLEGQPVQIFPAMHGRMYRPTPTGDPMIIHESPKLYSVRIYSRDGSFLQSISLPDEFDPWTFNKSGTSLVGMRPASNLYDLEIQSVDLNTGAVKLIDDSPGTKRWPEWSPDETRVIFTDLSVAGHKIMSVPITGIGVAIEIGVGYSGIYSPSGSLFAFFRFRDEKYELHVRNEFTSEDFILTRAGRAFRDFRIRGFSPDESHLLYSVGAESFVISLTDSSIVEIPPEFNNWGPDGQYLNGHRDGWLVRAPYSNQAGFEFTGEIERLFKTGPQANYSQVFEDRIVVLDLRESEDFGVLTWWQNWAQSLSRE